MFSATLSFIIGIGFLSAFFVAGGLATHFIFSNWLWIQAPFHSTIEALGGLAGLSLAVILLLLRRGYKKDTPHYLWLASGLIGMGVLDIFHASVSPGNLFVWLHSTAVFVGGLFFAAVWLPVSLSRSKLVVFLPVWVAIATSVLGLFSIFSPQTLPLMVVQGIFTPAAGAINYLGAFFFLLSTIYLINRYRKKRDPNELVFINLSLLFGIGGLLFYISELWQADWWWWHFVRLTAYFIALQYELTTYKRLEQEREQADEKVKKLNKDLEQRVKERTQELEIAKNKSETLLASIGDGVFAIDREQNIIHLNRRAEELSGYKTSEVLGKPYYDFLKFIKVEDKSENIEFIRGALKGRAAAMTDKTVLIGKDKKELPVADTAAPIKDKEGKILGVIVIFRDATQERELERMRAELISLTGHQLRTPLTVIKGYLELLKESKLSAEAKEYADKIEKNTKEMTELIDDVLNVSRIEQGRIEFKPEPIRLEAIVDGLIKDFLPLSKKRNIIIEFEKLQKPFPEVSVDPKYLREAVQNIISNAINYTKDKVVIFLKKLDHEICFVCADNGIGIPKEEQSKIFTKFYRASNIVKTGVRGTGLGLTITKAIIEQHRGRIWFESEENKGTTFYITLPFFL